ncbi:MAG: hypothetical protein JWM77_1863 [Rhodospirillales bacterium]|nr:hypothetical protein [Rhodospirillales bacterium]
MLIDTHIYLQLRQAVQKLSTGERKLLDRSKVVFVSVVSLWEAAMLHQIGRIKGDLEALIELPAPLVLLPIEPSDCLIFGALPAHHRDPFDRMLIAQAVAKRTPILSRDEAFAAYTSSGLMLLSPA